MKSRYSTKYFPFSPGIPWKVKNGKYVLPEISYEVWQSVMADKMAVVMAFGGLLEAFCSLSILEALKYENASRQLYWAGPEGHDHLYRLHGISLPFPHKIDPEDIKNYPVPIFLDKSEKIAYFNSLNNYLTFKDFSGNNYAQNDKSIIEQVAVNSIMDWKVDYLPRLRCLESVENNSYNKFLKNNSSLHANSRFVLLLPHKTEYSMHNFNCLQWSATQVRELAAMLKGIGVATVVCSDEKSRYSYYNTPIYFADLDIAFTLMSKAWAIFSSEIDYLLITMILGRAAIVSQQIGGAFDLYKNADFIQSENIIFSSAELTPFEAFMFLKDIR